MCGCSIHCGSGLTDCCFEDGVQKHGIVNRLRKQMLVISSPHVCTEVGLLVQSAPHLVMQCMCDVVSALHHVFHAQCSPYFVYILHTGAEWRSSELCKLICPDIMQAVVFIVSLEYSHRLLVLTESLSSIRAGCMDEHPYLGPACFLLLPY